MVALPNVTMASDAAAAILELEQAIADEFPEMRDS